MKTLDWLEEFFFKYFSYATKDDENSWVRYVVWLFFTLLAAAGITCDATYHEDLAKVLFSVFTVLFFGFAIVWIIVWFYHNWKIKQLNKRWK